MNQKFEGVDIVVCEVSVSKWDFSRRLFQLVFQIGDRVAEELLMHDEGPLESWRWSDDELDQFWI